MRKTEVVFNNYDEKEAIKVDKKEIVDEYIYLGKIARTDEGMHFDLNRRILSEWEAFRKHEEVICH